MTHPNSVTDAVATAQEAAQNSGDPASAAVASNVFPCSYSQRRIWFTQTIDPDGSQWNVAMRWRLVGKFSDAAVERAWQCLVERHEALRTTIEEIDGVPHQRVWVTLPVKFNVTNLSRLPADQRAEAAKSMTRVDAERPIPLSGTGPLFRIGLVRIDDTTSILLTNFHNIIVDGWSVGVLIREFGELVTALDADRQVVLAPIGLQQVDYTLWQADMVEGGGFEEDRSYWGRRLAGSTRTEVDPDYPRPPVQTHAGTIRSILLPRALSDAVTDFSIAGKYSIYHIATASLAAVLAKRTGKTDVIFGTQVACRDEPELQGIVGSLSNTVALRLDLSNDPRLSGVLQHTRERAVEALSHQQLPFNFVVADLNPTRDPSRSLVYSITVATQTAHIDTGRIDDLRFGGLTIGALPSFSSGAPTDLGFFMVGREEGWRVSCAGNSDLFKVATIDGLLDEWARALEAIITSGETRLSALADHNGPHYIPAGIEDGGLPTVTANAPAEDAECDPRLSGPEYAVVVAIWKELLGRDDVDGTTDFFDAGGTSLSMLRMLARVNKSLDRRVPLAKVLSQPRLSDFMAMVVPASETPAPSTPGIPVPTAELSQARRASEMGGTRPTGRSASPVRQIIALNNGYAFVLIGRAMGERRAIVDVPVGDAEDTDYASTHSFPETVARVTARIRKAQSEGPYVLMAYCGLGIVAEEAARQLEAEGQEVRLLVMLNATAPDYIKSLPWRAKLARRRRQVHEAIENFRILLQMRQRQEITTGVLLQHYSVLRRLGVVDGLRRLGLVEAVPPHNDYVESFEFFENLKRGYFAYRQPKRAIAADIAVFRTTDVAKGRSFPLDMGWSRTTSGSVDVHEVDGRHIDMLRSVCAAEIGRALDRLLDAQDPAGTSAAIGNSVIKAAFPPTRDPWR